MFREGHFFTKLSITSLLLHFNNIVYHQLSNQQPSLQLCYWLFSIKLTQSGPLECGLQDVEIFSPKRLCTISSVAFKVKNLVYLSRSFLSVATFFNLVSRFIAIYRTIIPEHWTSQFENEGLVLITPFTIGRVGGVFPPPQLAPHRILCLIFWRVKF